MQRASRVCLPAPSSPARSCKGTQVPVSSVTPMCTCTRVPACTGVCTALTRAKPGGRSPPRPRVPAQSRAAGGRRRLCSTRPVLFLLLPELRGSLSAVAVTHAGRQTPGEAREGCSPPLCRWLFVTSPSQVAVGAGRGRGTPRGWGWQPRRAPTKSWGRGQAQQHHMLVKDHFRQPSRVCACERGCFSLHSCCRLPTAPSEARGAQRDPTQRPGPRQHGRGAAGGLAWVSRGAPR